MCKKRLRKLVPLLLAVMMLFSIEVAVFAAVEMPDLTKTGTITVSMTDPEAKIPVAGGSLTMYQVCDVIVDDGFKFSYTDAFAPCNLSLEDIQSKDLVAGLVEYANAHDLKGETKNIGMNGTVEFTGLELGLYLMVQTEAAGGYFPVDSFLVTVPMKGETEAGEVIWIYDVDASPKVELEKVPPTPTPTPEPGLPQTGQLNWPIPVLAVAGIAFFVIGWCLRCRERKTKNA